MNPRHISIQLVITSLLVVAISAIANENECQNANRIKIEGLRIILGISDPLPLTLDCPQITISGKTTSINQEPSKLINSYEMDHSVIAVYDGLALEGKGNLDVKVHIQWFPEENAFRKWVEYRVDSEELNVAEEIILEKLNSSALLEPLAGIPPQSYPVFIKTYYLGIEFPIAFTRMVDEKVVLAYKPGTRLEPGKWYSSHKLICGLTERGKEKETFLEYISNHRPTPKGFHLNYNSWWTSSVPYTEQEILTLMDQFQTHLYEPYGISFDTFAIDMGWSTKDKVWEIDKEKFPNGFSNIQQKIGRMKGNLGLWISPSNFYSPASFDNDIAEENGYKTMTIPWGDRKVKLCCLGSEKYSTQFRESLVDMVTRFGIRHIKFDGYYLSCPAEDHGHLPGELSSEQIALGCIEAWQAIRKVAPDIWFETTCFGNPSPWWLFYVNSVIGMHGDDAPYGRVPCPVYRESYTTARDYFNLQGAAMFPIPHKAQEVLGIIHQTDEPFLNDGIMTILRGHMFVPLYVNPTYMNELRWRQIAELIKWARKNSPVLENTQIILPKAWQNGSIPHLSDEGVMPKEVYGYSHFTSTKGIVGLRNPWIDVQDYSLVLDEKIGVSKEMKNLHAVSVYPQVRVYGKRLSYGDKMEIKIAPYETLVLEFSEREPETRFPAANEVIGSSLITKVTNTEIKKIEYSDKKAPYGPNWVSLVGDSNGVIQVKLDADIFARQGDTKLAVLLESDDFINLPQYKLVVNGEDSAFAVSGSEGAWTATVLKEPEKWMFLLADLPEKKNQIQLTIDCPHEKAKVSVWALNSKSFLEYQRDDYSNALCCPEVVYFDSKRLVGYIDSNTVAKAEKIPFPVSYIEGIYLDVLEPVSFKQDWGDLEKNKSVWKKPLTLNGKKYLRGIGTHANGHIIYDLGGRYKEFKSVVGLDSAATGSVKFKVVLDDVTAWESGIMKNDTPAETIRIDVRGVKTMELIVEDAGSIEGDHANFANAILVPIDR